jgi:hypothetical protein
MRGKQVYNTGKVEIGKYYEPPKVYVRSRDMELLQRALLGERGIKLSVVMTCYVVFLALIVGGAFLLR